MFGPAPRSCLHRKAACHLGTHICSTHAAACVSICHIPHLSTCTEPCLSCLELLQVVLITALAAVASGAFLPNQGLLPLGKLHCLAVLCVCQGAECGLASRFLTDTKALGSAKGLPHRSCGLHIACGIPAASESFGRISSWQAFSRCNPLLSGVQPAVTLAQKLLA